MDSLINGVLRLLWLRLRNIHYEAERVDAVYAMESQRTSKAKVTERENIRFIAECDDETDQNFERQINRQRRAAEIDPNQNQQKHAARYLQKTPQNHAHEPLRIRTRNAITADFALIVGDIAPLFGLEMRFIIGGDSARDSVERENDRNDH